MMMDNDLKNEFTSWDSASEIDIEKIDTSEWRYADYLELQAENRLLREALEGRCEYHHLPLLPEGSPEAWGHQLDNGKIIRCRLSKKERQALAATDS